MQNNQHPLTSSLATVDKGNQEEDSPPVAMAKALANLQAALDQVKALQRHPVPEVAKLPPREEEETALRKARYFEDVSQKYGNQLGNLCDGYPKPTAEQTGLQTMRKSCVLMVHWKAGPDAAANENSAIQGLKCWLETYRDVFDVAVDVIEPTEGDAAKAVGMPELMRSMEAYLDTIRITPKNIGRIREKLFLPFDTAWNAAVRDMTAARERS
jgi:hypothetical protein